MKNFIKKIKGGWQRVVISVQTAVDSKKAEGYVDTGVKILIAVVIGALLLPMMLLSAVLITLPMFIVAIVCKGKAIGGADVKLSAACAFLLGISKGCIGLIAGMLAGIVVNFIIQKIKKKKEGFPLIPYLAAGFMAAYFI